MIDQQISSLIEQQSPYELSIKKLSTDFTEISTDRAIVCIHIKQVHNCQIQFTETNFTVIFYTKFENFNECKFIFSIYFDFL
jgi:hypothetical protein